MKIEQIPSDEIVVMTSEMHRLFNAAGCNPMCHCCKEMIPIGNKFHLGTIERSCWERGEGNKYLSSYKKPTGKVESKEVMLCDRCTPETYKYLETKMFEENEAEFQRLKRKHIRNGGGCFRINGKIVH